MSGSVSAALRRASSASRAARQDPQLVERRHALAPLRGVGGPARDGEPERDRAGVGDDDVEVGRLGDDRHVAGHAGPDRREHPLAAVLLGRHDRDDELAGQAFAARAVATSARTAARIAATPPFMSQAPRPNSSPSRIVAGPRVVVQVDGSPGGTTSTCPTSTIRRPPGAAEPADDDRQRRPGHLLARPVGVGPDVGEVRRRSARPPARSSASTGADVRDRLLGAGDARDPDERARSSTAARRRRRRPPDRRRSRRPRRSVDGSRRIGRVRQVGPPEPLIPISVAGIGVDLAAGRGRAPRPCAGCPRPG